MKLKDHVLSTSFDTLVPELIKLDDPVWENLYAFKEAYDILRRTVPAGPQKESIRVTILGPNEEDPETSQEQRIYAEHCGGDFWENNLAKEVVVEDGISMLRALAEIFWEMTYYGFDPYPREGIPLNRYEKKAEELEHRQFDNYARAKRGVLRGQVTKYALSLDGWEVYERRFAHRNRAKRMRDARQERTIKRYERLGKVEKAITRILDCTRALSPADLDYLFETETICEYEFFSRSVAGEDRAAYICDNLSQYFHCDLSAYTRAEILLCSSADQPLTGYEVEAIRSALLNILPMSEIRFSIGEKAIEEPSDLWVFLIVSANPNHCCSQTYNM